MIDLNDFEKLLKEQAEGSQVPIEAGPVPTEPAGSTPAGTPTSGLKDKIDTAVSLNGTARDAMLGAIVLLDNGVPVYIEGLDEWDDAIFSKKVEVTGTLRRKKLAPDPVVGPDGGISHGAAGTDYVLEAPKWTVLTP